MVKLKGRSALVIVLPVANMQSQFQLKIVDPTSYTNFNHLPVTHATVVQTEWEAKTSINKRTHKLIPRYMFFRDSSGRAYMYKLSQLRLHNITLRTP